MAVKRATGIPAALTRGPVRLIRVTDAAAVYAHPRPQLARLQEVGLLHRVAAGQYAVVPPERIADQAWRPTLEGAAAAMAIAEFGAGRVALMGISAARMHHGIPRALTAAVVAVPHRKSTINLTDRDATVRFLERDIDRIEAELMQTDLGACLVTTIEQTVLDLAHQPNLGNAGLDARVAIRHMLPRCSRERLENIARSGRREQALQRIDKGRL